jgi:hypothetical protein
MTPWQVVPPVGMLKAKSSHQHQLDDPWMHAHYYIPHVIYTS